MEYRQLGTSNIMLSAITAGAWVIGPKEYDAVEPNDAIKALQTAFDQGCTTIDTAPCYGLGFSEEIVAQAISAIPRDKIQLLTKCGLTWEGTKGKIYSKQEHWENRVVDIYNYASKEGIIEQCEESLRRLKTDYIDLYSIHWPDSTTPIDESMEAFTILINQGKIRAAGLCNHDMADIKLAANVFNLASNKTRYSMINRKIETNLIPYSLEKNISVLAYCVLQRGILTGMDVKKFLWANNDDPLEVAFYEPENMLHIKDFLKSIEPIARDHNSTLSQLAISWVLNQPGITVALLSASSPENVIHDTNSLNIKLTETERLEIDRLIRKLEGLIVIPSGTQATV